MEVINLNSLEPNQVRVSKTRISIAKNIMDQLEYAEWGKAAAVEVSHKGDNIFLDFFTSPSGYGVKCNFDQSRHQIYFAYKDDPIHFGTYQLVSIDTDNCVCAKKINKKDHSNIPKSR